MAIGPTAGGLLVDSFGWRGLFYVILPFAAATVALAIGYVTESFALRRYSQALERQRGEDLGERGLWGRD